MSNSNGKLLFALLGGLAAGAALALLFAPAKGSETRQIIADKTKGFTGNLGKHASDLMNSARDVVRNNKEQATASSGNGKV